jgi:hypothetical protein
MIRFSEFTVNNHSSQLLVICWSTKKGSLLLLKMSGQLFLPRDPTFARHAGTDFQVNRVNSDRPHATSQKLLLYLQYFLRN